MIAQTGTHARGGDSSTPAGQPFSDATLMEFIMTFDLSKFDTATLADKGAPINIVSPLGDVVIGSDGNPVQFFVLGQDSKKFKADISEARRQAQAQTKTNNKKTKSPEEEEAEAIVRIAGYTVGWTNNFELDGDKFPFSQENAVKLYSDARFQWIYEQINRQIMNRANFLQA